MISSLNSLRKIKYKDAGELFDLCKEHDYGANAILQEIIEDKIRFYMLHGRDNMRQIFIDRYNKKNYSGAVTLFSNFNSLAKEYFCCLTFDKIAKKDWSKVLGEVYTMENYWSSFQRLLSDEDIVKLFAHANKNNLMNKSELKMLNSLPDTFTIYRGYADQSIKIGFSWSLSKEVAKFFAHRYNKSSIITTTAKKEDVLVYFNRREEDEIIINPANISGEVIEKRLRKMNKKTIEN